MVTKSVFVLKPLVQATLRESRSGVQMETLGVSRAKNDNERSERWISFCLSIGLLDVLLKMERLSDSQVPSSIHCHSAIHD